MRYIYRQWRMQHKLRGGSLPFPPPSSPHFPLIFFFLPSSPPSPLSPMVFHGCRGGWSPIAPLQIRPCAHPLSSTASSIQPELPAHHVVPHRHAPPRRPLEFFFGKISSKFPKYHLYLWLPKKKLCQSKISAKFGPSAEIRRHKAQNDIPTGQPTK